MNTGAFELENRGLCIPSLKEKQYILLHPSKPKWMVINEMGYKILSLYYDKVCVKDIARQVIQPYDIPFDTVLSDVKTFLAQITRSGFLSPLSPAQLKKQPYETNTPALKKVHLNITENCNLHCKHCGVFDGVKKKEYLSLKQIFQIIEEAKEIGVEFLAIGGGEPFYRKDCLKILSYAVKKIKTVLTTNGTLIDDNTAHILVDLGLDMQISLDGPNEAIHDFMRGKGAFVKTMKAIDFLVKLGFGKRICLCVTLSRNNINHIPAMLNLASSKGVSSVRFIPLQKMGTALLWWDKLALSPHDYSLLYKYLYLEAPTQFPELEINPGFQGLVLHHPPKQDMWCLIGQMVAIDAKGDFYPCSLLMEPSFRLGNIQEMSLKGVWESSGMKRIRELCLLRKSSIFVCKTCCWKHFCQAGCPGSIYLSKGAFHELDDLCGLRQDLYPQLILDRANKKSLS